MRSPGILLVVALVILAIGVPIALRSRRPRISLVAVAVLLGVACLWLRPALLVPWLPSTLPFVILALALFVLPDAWTFHDPGEFRVGVFMVAGSVASFWPLQTWIAHRELGFWEYKFALHVVTLLFSVCLFGGGVFYLRIASGSPGSEPGTRCPECARRTVRVTLRAPDTLHYCCDTCEHLWTVQTSPRKAQ